MAILKNGPNGGFSGKVGRGLRGIKDRDSFRSGRIISGSRYKSTLLLSGATGATFPEQLY